MSQIVSIQSREIFSYNGYMYVFDTYNYDGTKQFWRCRNKCACKSKIHISTETSVVSISLFMSTILSYYFIVI